MSPLTNNQHDSACTLIKNGKVICSFEEERFSRYKHALGTLPIKSITESLRFASISIKDIHSVFVSSEIDNTLKTRVELYFKHYFGHSPKVYLINHQLCHMASAYYQSNFDKSLVVSLDGFGDNLSCSIGVGYKNKIKILKTKNISQSLGIFYQTLTQYMGFGGIGDEYKVMGLSAYGKPNDKLDLSKIIKISKYDYKINPKYLYRNPKQRNLFEPRYGNFLIKLLGQPRLPGQKISNKIKDLAYAVQNSFELALFSLIRWGVKKTKLRKLSLAGGCALNCLANMKLLENKIVDDLFVQPAATDQGTSLGAAIIGSIKQKQSIKVLSNYYLGKKYSKKFIKKQLDLYGINYTKLKNPTKVLAESLKKGNVVALYQGRSEFGPRALGNRSILANPGYKNMKNILNRKIKFREEFRPFAPVILQDFYKDVFDMKKPSSYMTVTFRVKNDWKNRVKSITHIDNTARVQTLNIRQNIFLYKLIKKFYKLTKIPLLINTSFNIKNEPIVESPQDAIRTFYSSGIDELFLDGYYCKK